MINKNRGITIITLVITIIILLILAGISIASLIGNNGLLNKALQTKEISEKATIIEQIQTEIMAKQAENMRTELSEDELKEILMKYVEREEDIKYDETDTSKILSIVTKTGKYEILLSEIWDGKIVIDKDNSDNNQNNGQDSSSTEVSELKKEIEALKTEMKTMKDNYDNKINIFEENINKKQDKLNVTTGTLQPVGDYLATGGSTKVKKYGNIVTVQFSVAAAKEIPANQPFLVVPKEFCPSSGIASYVLEANGYACHEISLNTAGEIRIQHATWNYGWMVSEFSYICE